MERREDDFGCCDVCAGYPANSRLDILARVPTKRKLKRVRRAVDPKLEETLKEIRERVFCEHPAFRMLGVSFFCPDSTIKKICEEAEYARDCSDFTVQLRAELKDKIYSAVLKSFPSSSSSSSS